MKFNILFVLFSLFSGVIHAAENNTAIYQHGKKVHQNHCLKCHTDEKYTRKNRFVKSLNALGKQVRVCKDNTNAPWFDEDTDAVVDFLNKKYYRF